MRPKADPAVDMSPRAIERRLAAVAALYALMRSLAAVTRIAPAPR